MPCLWFFGITFSVSTSIQQVQAILSANEEINTLKMNKYG